ncbi:MAG TPA: Hsp20/alpha crystallin family protein [Rickettsiales bacterium]|nr:Hsp20/alpha crystallin family protein [Rickettsiales bacterium]
MLNKNGEALKEYKTKVNIKVVLMLFILIVICIIQFNQNRKIDRLVKYIILNNSQTPKNFPPFPSEEMDDMSRKKFIGHIRHEFFNNLNKEMREMDAIKERIEREMKQYYNGNTDSDNIEIGMDKPIHPDINFDLKTEEKYNKEQKNYTLNVFLPKEIKENNIDISIDKNLLYLKISKNEAKKDNKEMIESDFTSLKVISLPKTKALTKDIKKTFKDGKLTIVVPII